MTYRIVASWTTDQGRAARTLRTIRAEAAAAAVRAFDRFGVFNTPWPGFGRVERRQLVLVAAGGRPLARRTVR